MFDQQLQLNTIGVIRAALSDTLDPIDSYKIGIHPHVIQLFNGMTNIRPRAYKEVSTWNVDKVLNFIISLGPNWCMSTDMLTKKLAMLMALAAGARCSEICSLQTNHMRRLPNGINFRITRPRKSKRSAVLPGELHIPLISNNKDICPVNCLDHYLLKTFGDRIYDDIDPLFRAISKTRHGVKPTTISGWLTNIITLSGVDAPQRKQLGHSVRSLAASKARDKGFSVHEIMDAIEWKTQSVFTEFYDQSSTKHMFGRKVLEISENQSQT